MQKNEMNEFIERMEELGDVWNVEEVQRVYGNTSLEEALQERMGSLNIFGDIINKVINTKSE